MTTQTAYRIDDQLFVASADQAVRITCRQCAGVFDIGDMHHWNDGMPSLSRRTLDGTQELTVLNVGDRCNACVTGISSLANSFESFLAEAVDVAEVIREGNEAIGRLHYYWGPFVILEPHDGRTFPVMGNRCGSVDLDFEDCRLEADIPPYAYKVTGSDKWHTFEQWLIDRRASTASIS